MSKKINNWKDKAWFGLLLIDEVPVSYRFKPQDKVLPARLEFESLEARQANSLTDTGYRNEFFPNIESNDAVTSATDLVQQYLQARIPKSKVVLIARTTQEQEADEVLKGIEELYRRLDRNKEAADARSRIGKPFPKYFDLAGYERVAKAAERQVNIAKGNKNEPYDFPKMQYAEFERIVMSGRKRTIELSENKRVEKAMQTGFSMYNELLSLIGKYGWEESDLRYARGMAMADLSVILGIITGSLQRILSQEQAKEKGYKRADETKRETAYKSFYDNITKAKKVQQTATEELVKKKEATKSEATGERAEQETKVLELREGIELEVGMFLRRPDEPFFIEILNIEEKDYRNIGKRQILTYRNHMLSTISTYDSGGVYWENFQKNNREAEVLTKAATEKLWQQALQPIPEKEQTALVENIKQLIKNENLQTAEFELQDYFRKVVLREPEQIKTFFHLRNAIPNKKFRPCLCTEDLREDVRRAFYERLEENLFAYIPKDSLVCKVTKKASTPRSKKEPVAKQPKKPEVIQAILDNPSVPLLTWLDGQIELWKNRQSNKKITKIMVIVKTGEIVIEYTHYDKLLRVADLRYSYHKICPETAKLTKMLPPTRGSYRMLVTKQALKEQYATNRNWEECQLWIREAYQCSRDGDCSKEQKELFSLYYKQCGDQRVKEENIAYLRWLHKKAGEQWKRGEESYLVAFARVKRELKEQ